MAASFTLGATVTRYQNEVFTHVVGPYTIHVVELELPPHLPEQYYWHLYRNDQKINGGLADDVEKACFMAGMGYRRDLGVWATGHGERV